MHSASRRRVKIVCTLGPASQSPKILQGLIESGMDVARLNFSHGDHSFHKETISTIRDDRKKKKKNVAIMQDLQGPKIRVGKLPQGKTTLNAGDIVLLHPEGKTPKGSTTGKIAVPISAEIAEAISSEVRKGAKILFDDGKIITHVTQVSVPEIVIEVEVGGVLKDHKGMNLPGTPLTIPCLTDKDLEDLKFGISQGVDAVALSFVRSENDIEDLRKRIKKQKGDKLKVQMEVDKKEKKLSGDFLECIADEPKALEFFYTLTKSHQHYFSNWIESAKTDGTKAKRIAQAVNALAIKLGFPEMLRMNQKKNLLK